MQVIREQSHGDRAVPKQRGHLVLPWDVSPALQGNVSHLFCAAIKPSVFSWEQEDIFFPCENNHLDGGGLGRH